MRWDAVTDYNVDRYGVMLYDRDKEGELMDVKAAKGTSLEITGLNSGHRYGVWVASYVGMVGSLSRNGIQAGGLPSVAREVIIGRGRQHHPPDAVWRISMQPQFVFNGTRSPVLRATVSMFGV